MSCNDDVLCELDEQEVDQLLIILEECLPNSIVIYNWILKHREWNPKIQTLNFKILSPASMKIKTGCAAVCVCQGVSDKQYGVIFATEENNDLLKQCLTETKLIPWEKFSHFTGVLESHAKIMESVLQIKGFKTSEDEISQSFLLHIPIEEALRRPAPQIPDGYYLKPVNLLHISEATDIWDDYKQTVEKMFELNLSVAAFRKADVGVKDDLVAMNVQAEYGGVSALQVAPEHQRKGFGTCVLTELTRKMAQIRIHPHAHVLRDNFKSLGLFEKCGYRVVQKSFWIFVRK
ncbi:uncharacterized protein LOC132196705 [Neocloeon triangulifer]|uniref:uncharacterized protein LOC132196705 n=1 Tax=Neocloeon triangulifer TaxID=2078957 RepID=UPI00286F258C|nr:uncharacterized protein LOC132196705 [Neocloeon triangulifer]XP_059475513.1 uncharacterized protein LOC132196705 [Neocloeon triangulifer]